MENLQTKSEKQYYIPMEVNETSKESLLRMVLIYQPMQYGPRLGIAQFAPL